jgi:hypothetical protein
MSLQPVALLQHGPAVRPRKPFDDEPERLATDVRVDCLDEPDH